MKLGIEKIAMVRVRAGISYAPGEAMNAGHCGALLYMRAADYRFGGHANLWHH
jgi:hypothetical protein